MYLSGLIVQYDSVNITKTRIVAIIRHDKRTDMQNNQHFQAFYMTAHYWGSKF